ncbi:hypothetical protein ACIQXI_06045 [Lysinibacillus sp. NPDC097195]|uniref:hypothetical protein n=1 Tax=Lysinibacillus sp. NPDC097195 TaxID=3364141 RepID=UPI00382534F7
MIYVKKAMIFLVFIFMIVSFPSITSACSCADLPSVEQEFERSIAVFSGKVIEIKEKRSLKGYTLHSVLFEVTNTWKGVKQSQLILSTGQGDGDCGYPFIKGQEYLVYADDSSVYGGKSLVTVTCDRTNILSTSQEDLEILGAGQPPIEEVNLSSQYNRNQLYVWATSAIVIAMIVYFIVHKRKKLK